MMRLLVTVWKATVAMDWQAATMTMVRMLLARSLAMIQKPSERKWHGVIPREQADAEEQGQPDHDGQGDPVALADLLGGKRSCRASGVMGAQSRVSHEISQFYAASVAGR